MDGIDLTSYLGFRKKIGLRDSWLVIWKKAMGQDALHLLLEDSNSFQVFEEIP